MTTAAIGPPRPRSFGLLGSWLSVRHSLRVEAAAALTLYGLYDPYAALPSRHVGYALIVAAALLHHGRHLLVRALGALYPPFVVFVIVATGNHFFLDAAAGALVAGLGAALAALLTWRPVRAR